MRTGPEIKDEYAVEDHLQFTTQFLYKELGIIVQGRDSRNCCYALESDVLLPWYWDSKILFVIPF
jgi:hypothetical protein